MPTRLRLLLSLAVALLCTTAAHTQVPTWPKVTPAEVTAAGIGVQLTGVDYGNGTFVLATYFGGTTAVPAVTPVVFTSPDGTTWTRRSLPGNGRTAAPRFLNGKFLLGVQPDGPGNGAILSSTDGATWTSSGAISSNLNAPSTFAFGNGIYAGSVSSPVPGANQIVTSTDGVTWTPRSVFASGSSNHVVFFNGKFYATVYNYSSPTNPGGLFSSADGITWTRIATAPASPGILAASPTTLLVTTFSGSTSGQSLSTDGVTFTTASPGLALLGESIRYLNGAFVTVAPVSATVFDYTLARASLDGRTWATIGSTANEFYATEVAYGNGRYVFVGEFNVYAGATTISPGGSSTGGGGGTAAPTVATQPVAQSAAIGGSVTFTAVGAGTGLTYQWWFNNAAIAGATSASYTLAAVTAAHAGQYSVVVTNSGGSITSNPATLTIAPASAGIAYLGNLSVRARAGSGSETLIVGVTVGGSTTATAKSVLVRGIGPTLTAFGVTGVLTDPVLTVLSGTTPIATNDDWGSDTNVAATSAAVGAFALPVGSRDSALFGTGLGSGGYTVQLTGKSGATGNALIELYDTAAAAGVTANTTRFTNLSARTFGGTGADTLIVGFNVAGTGSRRLVIRAVGPSLTAFGVTGTMLDPKIELYQGQTKVGENDNWEASTLAAQQAVGGFALISNSRDAVLVSTLTPGSYTVQVTGGTTGVALVEVYEAP